MRRNFSKWMETMALAFMLCLAGLVMSGTAFARQCVDNEDGTVTDKADKLVWQKETAGPNEIVSAFPPIVTTQWGSCDQVYRSGWNVD